MYIASFGTVDGVPVAIAEFPTLEEAQQWVTDHTAALGPDVPGQWSSIFNGDTIPDRNAARASALAKLAALGLTSDEIAAITA